ncbi:hypothetical protein CDL12_15928, partial [Handroanthus impetiginosus]
MAGVGKEKADPDFTDESSWELGRHGSDNMNHGYFFGSDYKDSSVLTEFGWNIPAEPGGVCGCDGGVVDFDGIEADLAGSRGDYCVSVDSSAPRSKDVGSIGSSIEPMVVEEKVSASPANPSMSSSSSEDRPEKSTASGVSS